MNKERRKFLKTAGAVAIGGGVLLGAPAVLRAQSDKKTFRWKMASVFPAGQPGFLNMCKAPSELIKRMSNGRLVIDVFPVGAIAPFAEITDAARKGVCQIANTWPGLDIGLHPATCVIGGFCASPNSEIMLHWIYEGGGQKLWQDFRQEKFNIHAIPAGMRSTEVALHSHKPVRNLEDFKGLKIRTVGAWADIVSQMGASVITLAGPEVLPALERKVIDATEWGSPGENLPMGFHEIAKYVVIPGIHQPSSPFEWAVNMKAWEELPDDLKAILETAAKATTMDSWVQFGTSDINAFETWKKRGNIIIELSPKAQGEARRLGIQWAEQHAAKDTWFKKIWESQKTFAERWKNVEPNRILHYE